MINVITNHPIAIDSDDHHYPDGIHLDNHFNVEFAERVERHFNRKIDILDLGTAGGGLVTGMLSRGHNAVGLEGSDHCFNINQKHFQTTGTMPLGYENWKNYRNKNLFTCDITYDYEIQNNGQLMQFDLITCFDVMEHFYEDRIDKFLQMVVKHLKPDGLFAAAIALTPLLKDKETITGEEGQVDYHKSLFSIPQWLEMLSKHLKQVEYPFIITNRWYGVDGVNNFTYAGMKP